MKTAPFDFQKRIIGSKKGATHGSLLFVFAAVHGNEPAGVHAFLEVLEFLNNEEKISGKPHFSGKIVGILGNSAAFHQKKRFIDVDLNRIWTTDFLKNRKKNEISETREIHEILAAIRAEIKAEQPENIVFLDLHTTSAEGGVFLIPMKNKESRALALQLGMPVIHGILDEVEGTMLDFFSDKNLKKHVDWQPKNKNSTVKKIAFEAGQHLDKNAVQRAKHLILNILKVESGQKPVEFHYFLEKIPHESKIIFRKKIEPTDNFKMLPGFENFQKIEKKQLLAHDRFGEIRSPEDGYILMPLYQKQGSDGFFIVKKI